MTAAPTLTAYLDANPSPRVLVTVTVLATGTQTVTITRVTEGRSFKVRGGVNLYAVGGVVVMDYECPFGVVATYRVEMFDVNGLSLGFTDAAAVTLAVTQTWIHQPLKPLLAVNVTLLLGTADALVRKSPGNLIYPEGATTGTWIGTQREGLTGTKIAFIMNSTSDADRLQSMFGGYTTDFPAILCIRTAAPIRLPRILFAACSAPSETSMALGSIVTFDLTVDEVAAPFPGLIIPTLRRADIDAAFTTRSARAAAYSTRLQRDSDYSKAGLAG